MNKKGLKERNTMS